MLIPIKVRVKIETENRQRKELFKMKAVYKGGEGEIVEKKSRFIATVRPVESEEEAMAFVAEMKKKYWDARHNCHAFVTGANQELSRCSDDGEPAQTAGRPMLDVLLREELHNTAVVVTRYFGGTLLGTGGLVRAYQKDVQEGLANSIIIDKLPGKKLIIHTDYTGLGKIQYVLAQQEITTMGTDYTDTVGIHVVVPAGKERSLTEKITEATGGTARFSWGKEVEFALIDKEIEIFEK